MQHDLADVLHVDVEKIRRNYLVAAAQWKGAVSSEAADAACSVSLLPWCCGIGDPGANHCSRPDTTSGRPEPHLTGANPHSPTTRPTIATLSRSEIVPITFSSAARSSDRLNTK